MTVALERRKRLSEGVLAEATIRGRVLGIPLLRLDATVALVPAGVTASSAATHEPPARTTARSSRVRQTSSRAGGGGLAEAVRSINEGAELLAEARRNGS